MEKSSAIIYKQRLSELSEYKRRFEQWMNYFKNEALQGSMNIKVIIAHRRSLKWLCEEEKRVCNDLADEIIKNMLEKFKSKGRK